MTFARHMEQVHWEVFLEFIGNFSLTSKMVFFVA